MNDLRNQLQGLWLPLVTPFRDGALDEISLRRLVRHYASRSIDADHTLVEERCDGIACKEICCHQRQVLSRFTGEKL